MKLTANQLDILERLGRCQFRIENCATILECDLSALRKSLRDKNTDAYKRYYKGRLQAEFEVREQIIDLATRNSSQAQDLFLKLRDQLKIDEQE